MSAAFDRIVQTLKDHGHDLDDRGMTTCPAHEDDKPSLKVSQGDRGAVLFCHAGCTVETIVGALGLKKKDLFDKTDSVPRELAVYRYTDEDVKLLFEVARREDKTFPQRRPDGNGGRIHGLTAGRYERRPGSPDWYKVKSKGPTLGAEVRDFPECRRVPFRLREILEAVKAGRTVYLPEGEKDVLTCVAWGLDATCNPGGAGKWRPEYSETLRGAHVVIIPDDDKPGHDHANAIEAALRGIAADVRQIKLPAGKDVTEWRDQHGGTRDQLEELALGSSPATVASEQHPTVGSGEPAHPTPNEKATQTDLLLELVTDMELWTTPNAVAYATVTMPDGHHEHHPVRSRDFRLTLGQRYFTRTGRAPSTHPLTDAMATIEALARDSGIVHDVAVRLAEHEGALYLDVADAKGQAVEITAAGWRVVTNPPVRFRRAPGMVALPVPVKGGSLEALRPFVPGGEDAFRLILGWLVQALRASGPYMVLILLGEQGTGKTLLARILRWLIDPNTVALRAVPREERDLAIAATNGFVVAIDNVSGLPSWVSDALCRISSGGGFATRELFSDDREALFAATRPILLNGIADVASRGDLIDRALLVTLPTIDDTERRDEREILADFQAAAPGIVGALCSAASTALARRDQVKLARLPRMADATLWIVAAEPVLPWTSGAFLQSYMGNRADAVEVALESDSMGGALRQLLGNKSIWSGTATDLLVDLGKLVDDPKPKDWPRSARSLSSHLTLLAPALRAVGLNVQRPRNNQARLIVVEKRTAASVAGDAKPSFSDANLFPSDAKPTPSDARVTQNLPPKDPIGDSLSDEGDASDAKFPHSAQGELVEEKGRKERVEVEV